MLGLRITSSKIVIWEITQGKSFAWNTGISSARSAIGMLRLRVRRSEAGVGCGVSLSGRLWSYSDAAAVFPAYTNNNQYTRGTLLELMRVNFHSRLVYTWNNIQGQNSARSARLIFALFLIGLRQVKVVDGIHVNRCIHGFVKKKTRFRPRFVGAQEVPGRGERVLSLWFLSALLLFGPFAGQRKRGIRVGVCYYNTIYIYMFFFTHIYFPASGQAVVTDVDPVSTPVLAVNFCRA